MVNSVKRLSVVLFNRCDLFAFTLRNIGTIRRRDTITVTARFVLTLNGSVIWRKHPSATGVFTWIRPATRLIIPWTWGNRWNLSARCLFRPRSGSAGKSRSRPNALLIGTRWRWKVTPWTRRPLCRYARNDLGNGTKSSPDMNTSSDPRNDK